MSSGSLSGSDLDLHALPSSGRQAVPLEPPAVFSRRLRFDALAAAVAEVTPSAESEDSEARFKEQQEVSTFRVGAPFVYNNDRHAVEIGVWREYLEVQMVARVVSLAEDHVSATACPYVRNANIVQFPQITAQFSSVSSPLHDPIRVTGVSFNFLYPLLGKYRYADSVDLEFRMQVCPKGSHPWDEVWQPLPDQPTRAATASNAADPMRTVIAFQSPERDSAPRDDERPASTRKRKANAHMHASKPHATSTSRRRIAVPLVHQKPRPPTKKKNAKKAKKAKKARASKRGDGDDAFAFVLA
jgi:hypothetical protein